MTRVEQLARIARDIDEVFGKGYARANPVLVASYALGIDFNEGLYEFVRQYEEHNQGNHAIAKALGEVASAIGSAGLADGPLNAAAVKIASAISPEWEKAEAAREAEREAIRWRVADPTDPFGWKKHPFKPEWEKS